MQPDVCAVNLVIRAAVLDNDEEIPVVRMLDVSGEFTNDPDQAVSFVAGPDAAGNWYAAPMSAFDWKPN